MTQRYSLCSATRLQNEDGIINLSGKKEYYACRYKIDPEKKRRLNKLCFATRLTFGLLLSRLGIIQANLASPLTVPSVRNREGISWLRAHRPASPLLWSYYNA